MKILVDCGNHRIKWAFANAEAIHKLNVSAVADFGTSFQQACADLEAPIDQAFISSVNARALACVLAVLSDKKISCHQAQVTPGLCRLTIGYDDPMKLGVDRYLALLGALPLAPCLVVDAGTALTIDHLVVTTDGYHHKGGIIVPGQHTMRQSLLQHTDIQFNDQVGTLDESLWGQSTVQCLNQGVRLAQISLINQLYRATGLRIVGCGGDFSVMLKEVDAPEVHEQPKLVLSGLLSYAQLQPEFI